MVKERWRRRRKGRSGSGGGERRREIYIKGLRIMSADVSLLAKK